MRQLAASAKRIREDGLPLFFGEASFVYMESATKVAHSKRAAATAAQDRINPIPFENESSVDPSLEFRHIALRTRIY